MNSSTLATTSSQMPTDLQTKNAVKNAVILAAGKSSRFRESGILKPKVLMKVGGLRLLERAILTLNRAGVEHFRIVVGAYRDVVVPAMKAMPRLKHLDIEYVVCEDFEKGNGVSFGAGAAGFDEPFLLTMSDHIFSPKTVKDFIEKTEDAPHLPALACDPELDDVFDMDDATKVLSDGGFIGNIGKEIADYDLVDTGLFYFPKNYGKRIYELSKNGANSVSNIIQEFIDESGVRAVSLHKPMWQDVDNPSMKKEAERRLTRQITRPDDGWLTKKIGQVLTNPLSFTLADWGIHPNVITTLIFIGTMVGALVAASGTYWQIAFGAFIFQLASMFDGIDRQVSRLTYNNSKFGAWYSRFSQNVRPVIFFLALGISAWLTSGSKVYLLAVFTLAAMTIYMLVKMGFFTVSTKADTELMEVVPESTKPEYRFALFNSAYNFWRELNKQHMLAFVTFIFCIFFMYQAMFWLAMLGITATAVMVAKSSTATKMQQEGVSGTIFTKVNPIYFYLIGLIILVALIFSLELNIVAESMAAVGNQLFLIFSVAVLWITANTMCISILLKGKVSFPDLMYNQLTGDAYNSIIPLAGLGGEPYKIKHLTQWLDWHTATRAIVVDRLIHSSSGLLFSAICVTITLFAFDLKTAYVIPLAIMAVVFASIAGGMIWLALTSAPSRISGYFLKKLKIVEEYRRDPVSIATFAKAYIFKLMGRTFNLIEIYLIFSVIGILPEFFDLTAVAGFISTSAALFFVIPQGLGVNELGISTALDIIGYTAALGITFGLIRRARMIFWALFGVGLHLAVSVVKRVSWSRA
ncbi:MAG: lysylphosphatidylglycerol synthase domain-containing protein [Bacteroidota bacterium]